jgi:hypothetical protein
MSGWCWPGLRNRDFRLQTKLLTVAIDFCTDGVSNAPYKHSLLNFGERGAKPENSINGALPTKSLGLLNHGLGHKSSPLREAVGC